MLRLTQAVVFSFPIINNTYSTILHFLPIKADFVPFGFRSGKSMLFSRNACWSFTHPAS
jgi:hypothetical protein